MAFQSKANYRKRVHHYHAFGLKLASSIPLPELPPGSGPADVTVRLVRGSVEQQATPRWLNGGGDRIELRLEDMSFTIDQGRSIDIVAPPERGANDIRIWLLGTVMATLLHQRGYFALHGNAVCLPDGGVAGLNNTDGTAV